MRWCREGHIQVVRWSMILVCVASSCSRISIPTSPKAPILVEVSPAIAREVTDYAEFTGRTTPVEVVEVRARVSGYLEDVVFQEGQRVQEGDLLYRIDPRPYRLALEQAQSKLEEAESQILSAKAQHLLRIAEEQRRQAELVLAQKSFDRQKALADQGASTAAAKDEVEANLATAKSAIGGAQADVNYAETMVASAQAAANTAQSAVGSAQLNLEFTELKAPISGRISKTLVTKGNLIQSGDVGTGPVLTTIVSVNPIYVECDVDEGTVLKVRRLIQAGQAERAASGTVPISFNLADETGFPHHGVLSFSENRIATSTGTLRIRGIFDTAEQEILSGLFVRVRVPIGRPHQAVLISDRAIISDLGQKIVYVVNDKQEVVPRPVVLGATHFGLRSVEQGLQSGDRIIVNGIQRVVPGAVVEAKDVAMPGLISEQENSIPTTSTQTTSSSTGNPGQVPTTDKVLPAEAPAGASSSAPADQVPAADK